MISKTMAQIKSRNPVEIWNGYTENNLKCILQNKGYLDDKQTFFGLGCSRLLPFAV
jgi:hypothetical protein